MMATRKVEYVWSEMLDKDAIHLASAEQSGCDWLLTTDDRFIRHARGNTNVRVATPVEFIMENKDENV